MKSNRSSSGLATRLGRHFAVCATVAAAAPFLASEDASADVIYRAYGTVVPNTIDGLYINVETGLTGSAAGVVAGWDLNPYGTSTTAMSWFGATGGGCVTGLGQGGTTVAVANLTPGTLVSSTSTFANTASSVTAGGWQLNAVNSFGFRFVGADGATRYGWGRMQIGATMGVRTLIDIGYESNAGVAIAVGDEGGPPPNYDPCATFNPSAVVGANNLGVNTSTAADLDLTATCGSVIYKANYYKFVAPATRNYDFDTTGGGSDTVLAILDGCIAGSNVLDCNDDAGGPGSRVTLSAVAGATYYVVLGSAVAGVDLPSPYGIQCTPWYDPCDAANPSLGNATSNVALNQTTAEDLTLGTKGCGFVIYNANYFKYTPTATGSYTFNTCSSAADTRMAVLDGCGAGSGILGCNDDFCGTSSSVTVDLIATVPVYVAIGSSSAKSTLPSPLAVTVVPPPVPECVAAATAVFGDNVFDDTASTTPQTVKSNAAGTTTATVNKSMWFSFTPATTGAYSISLCGATGDTMLAIGDQCPGIGSRFEAIAFNDDSCLVAGSTTSFLASFIDATNGGATGTFAGFPLTQDLVAGTEYFILAGSFSGTVNITGILNINGPAQGNPADLNGDGTVGAPDLAILLGNWGGSGVGDLDGDGIVGAPDLAAVLGSWG